MSAEPTGFLYPFIDADEREAGALLADLAESVRQKARVSAELQTASLARNADALTAAAIAMTGRFAAGGRLLTFGNGGSSTDAAGVATAFGRSVTAIDLGADPAVLTALGNDVGFDVVFSRQVAALARPDDVALGISTSGGSANMLAAFAAARARGLLTVGVAGYGGGAMAASGDLDHCLVVDADSVHRVQEAHDSLLRQLRIEVLAAMA